MNRSSYGIVIQARTSSSRLPEKVLMDIAGKPMLLRQAERLKKQLPDVPLIIATSTESSDDPIEELCYENNLECFRGPLDDVMLRFIECARAYKLDFFVRVGADDPLIDSECCKHLILLHKQKKDNYDFIYASNKEGWPYGTAAELISNDALKRIHMKTEETIYLEHTIPYFFDYPNEFKIFKLKAPKEILRPDYYFTVDFPEDFELVRTIFERLTPIHGDYFSFKKVIELVDSNKDILLVNQHLHQGFDK